MSFVYLFSYNLELMQIRDAKLDKCQCGTLAWNCYNLCRLPHSSIGPTQTQSLQPACGQFHTMPYWSDPNVQRLWVQELSQKW